MNRSVLSLLILLAGVAYACDPRARSAEPEQRKVVAGPPIAAALDVTIRDGIEFAFHVTNNASRKLELLFPSGQTHEIVVVDSVGREVWRWSEGRMFTQALQNKLLESSASLSWEAAWRAEVPPGRYVAIGSLLSENKPLEERVEFEVR
ncbi:MAG TPA: BsuPI-related putative proteinase inhibitor [Gemmatimonadaceae bacterium]